MSLQSQLFRGDRALEAAAVSDPAHILPGSTGPHVQKIQTALILLDDSAIVPREFEFSKYGQSTAQAVLTYKQRRNIINPRYQTQADNIVGRMTMAALDSELQERQVFIRSRSCDYGPRFSSGSGLQFVAAGNTKSSVQAKSGFFDFLGPLFQPSPLELAISNSPTAVSFIADTRNHLNAVIKGDGSDAANLGSAALSRHYKVTARNDLVNTAKKLKEFLARMEAQLFVPKQLFRSGVGGGFAETPTPRDGKVYMCTGYATAGKVMRPLVLVHESFHNLDSFHQDFGGNPARDQGVKYHNNDAATQIRNAYAMSQYVLHIHEKKERFLEDND